MADFITPVFDILTRLCGYSSKWADSIRNLGDNLDSLKNASNALDDRYRDVKRKVETEENKPDPELKVLNEVTGWMGRVEVLQNEVKTILQQGDREIQAKCFGGRCLKNCRASYKLNKMVTKKLSDVDDLSSKGHFDVVAEKYARDLFEKLPVDETVGAESTFEELRSWFQNDEVGIISLYGMGGVGKTTLLKKFNNDFLSTEGDYIVIWSVASKDVDPRKIQDDIRKKLRIPNDNWEKADDKARLLYNILEKKKFVLLLDDVWERIDLLKLGVPSPNKHKCKIIFTTRSYEVCGLMDAKRRIGVKCLTPNKAFELFKEKVSETILENPLILSLAGQVVEECKGLPLALCTVGRAMSNKVTPDEWKRSLEILRSHPSKIQHVVEDVFYLLKFSYDGLPNDTWKSCFLYCALFPEDYNIKKEELIFLWIAEGFLAEFDNDIHEARKQGEDIISSLKYACLLEDGEKKDTVKMHDVIRDMALWVACDHEKKTRFFVNDFSKTSGHQVYNHAKWEEVEKLSFWGDGQIIYSSQRTHCPNLVTLLVRYVLMPQFPLEAFVLSITIRVLDLSGSTGITDLPSTIGVLLNLQHMNLSYTGIKKLPDVLKNFKKLRFLLLDGLKNLVLLKKVIFCLLSLQAFSARGCRFSVIDEDALLDELEGLNLLQHIRICISSPSSFQKILTSSKLQKCMCELLVRQCSVPHALNWLIHAPNLEVLELVECDLLEEVVNEDIGTVKNNIFANLTFLRLQALHDLRSICGVTLQFPSLKEIEVSRCPNLKKLPFNSQSALTNLRRVVGDCKWFHQLQWEDEDTKNLLSSKFRDSCGIHAIFNILF